MDRIRSIISMFLMGVLLLATTEAFPLMGEL